MIDLKKLQKKIYANKVAKGFNTTDINKEFCYIIEELGEAYAAYRKKLPDLNEELADVAIFLLGIAEILGIDLEQAIVEKVEKNKRRKYKRVKGVKLKVEDQAL